MIMAGLAMLLALSGTRDSLAEEPPRGIEQMRALEKLPLLRHGVQVHYEGSIDKLGKNADWDWWLYQDEDTGEWVICEAEGPGCLWNFAVHHALSHSDPVYRFYFDGSDEPAYAIKHSEFGRKAPFLAPLADSYQPDVSKDPRLPKIKFRIVRSFCPMPFAKSMRITSSVKLEGNQATGGGWGHAVWHSYPTAAGIETFTGKEDYEGLMELWKNCGRDPKSPEGNETRAVSETLGAGERRAVFDFQGGGSITSVCLQLEPRNKETLNRVWIRITWDNEDAAAVECPVGAFFGNELGYNRVATLMQGTGDDGRMYCYWPMPFWESATIELENREENKESVAVTGEITYKPSDVLNYARNRTGHFRASAYQPMVPKESGRDSHVATVRGHGHMVSGLVTGNPSGCEGDVRVHIDGKGTPSVESDGSESWACYGWGFFTPPEMNPASCYDGTDNYIEWSMLRLLMGDFYPFRKEIHMTVEGGAGIEVGEDPRSGIIFWYGEPTASMALTDFLDIGDANSEKAHEYTAPGATSWELTSALEGECDHIEITDTGETLVEPSEFIVNIAPENQGVLLRRRSDQAQGGQRACVFVFSYRSHTPKEKRSSRFASNRSLTVVSPTGMPACTGYGPCAPRVSPHYLRWHSRRRLSPLVSERSNPGELAPSFASTSSRRKV